MPRRRPKHIEPSDRALVMEAARDRFPRDNPHGVFAFGIGRRVVQGRPTEDVTLNVYVSYKHPAPARPIEPFDIAAGKRRLVVTPNVIATGRAPRALDGQPAPFSGLYPGAPIRADGPSPGFGGVACFLGEGGSATHFVTAGHLFPPQSTGATVSAAIDANTDPVVVGTLAANLLDGGDVDAAAVKLTDEGRAMMAAKQDGPKLQSVLAAPSVFNKTCRAFRPTTHDFSQTTQTAAGPTDANLHAPTRGDYSVHNAVGTNGTVTLAGDSGTILCAGTSNQFAVGVLVGEFHLQSIAEPLGRVISLLGPLLGDIEFLPTGE
jgi:hypothetical protein